MIGSVGMHKYVLINVRTYAGDKIADQTAAYYTAIIMNPTMKTAWFQEHWG